ncbi:MAG: NF038122 family metalloprotease [Cyanobacteria bacterium J06633_8]
MNSKNIVSYLVYKISKPLGKITLTLVTLLCSTLPAEALNLKFTYGYGVTQKYKEAAETAELYWEDRITDNATINIHLDMPSASKLPANVLGGALPGFVNNINYSQFRNALINDRSSTYDNTAVNNLPNYGSYHWISFFEDRTQYSNKINLTRANAKALGLIDKHDSNLDGIIIMSDLSNSSYAWEDRRTDYVNSNEFDYTSVLIHEIGHTLGFVSAVDSINASNINDHQRKLNYATPFNLFTGSSFTQNSIVKTDITYGEDLFFSYDKGQTNLGYLSTGEDTNLGNFGKGDGWQASHWKHNIDAIMNPTLAPGDRRDATSRDLKVFDVLGWDIDYTPDWSTSLIVSSGIANARNHGNTNNNFAIEKMLKQSGWGGGSGGGSGGGNDNGGGFGQNMDLADYLAQQGLFQMGNAGALWSKTQAKVASVPEPTSILGLFGFGLLGLGWQRKRKSNQQYIIHS